MSQLRRLLAEIHRRSLWQMLGIYLVVSWMVYQVVLSLYDGIGLPDWVPPTALVLLLAGLPLVMATAFVQGGHPATRPQAAAENEAPRIAEDSGAAASSPASTTGTTGTFPVSATAAPSRRAQPTGPARFFTWGRAVTLVVLGFAGLGLASAGFMGMRALGVGPAATLLSSGALEERPTIVLADLEDATGDSTLGPAVREALRIDLIESPVLTLASPTAVGDALSRMERPAAAPLTAEVAREVAIRQGWPAVFAGKVARVGDTYVLTMDVLDVATGEVLAGFRESASGEEDIIPAVGRLSAAIRAKVGESLRSVRAGKPLPEATTSSLDALRAFAAGQAEEAVELDPDFAWAWKSLAIGYGRDGLMRRKEMDAMTRAYELRNRVNLHERGIIEGDYHLSVTGDWAASADAYRRVLGRFPDDGTAATNLAVALSMQRDFVAAESMYTKGARLIPTGGLQRMNVAGIKYAQGKVADAWEVLDRPDSVIRYPFWPARARARIAVAEGEFNRADSLIAALRAIQPGELTWTNHYALELETAVAGMRSGIARSRKTLQRHEDMARALSLPTYEIAYAAEAVLVTAAAGLDPSKPLAHLKTVIAEHGVGESDLLSYPYGIVAEAYVMANRDDGAQRTLAAFDSVEPDIGISYSDANRYRIARARALLFLRNRDHEAALDLLRRSYNLPCTTVEWTKDDLCFAALEGRAHEQAGRPDSAIAAYERYLSVKTTTRHVLDETDLAPTLEHLGELYEQKGDRTNAARCYARFMELWSDADPALQPRVEAARRALVRLTAES
ncbi:MAG: hypothetical protein P8099_12695 [Gemmatimonadota bacterium]